jgi:hypothetical protein
LPPFSPPVLPSSVSSGIEGFESLVGEAKPAIMDSEIMILDSDLVLVNIGRVLGQREWTRTGGM